MSCPNCAHCAGDLTSVEAIDLGRRVPGVAVPHEAKLLSLVIAREGLAWLWGWWKANRGTRKRVTVEFLADAHELVMHIDPPPPPKMVFRRRGPRSPASPAA